MRRKESLHQIEPLAGRGDHAIGWETEGKIQENARALTEGDQRERRSGRRFRVSAKLNPR